MNFKGLTIIHLLGAFVGLSCALQEDLAVTRLREYLRIPSVHPNPAEGYEQCKTWLRNQASELELDFNIFDLEEPSDFAIVLTWPGSNPSLKSVLLNSHLDVVAADPDKWTHHPFEAYKDPEGNIIARGASDMKSPTIAQLEAIRGLKADGFQPLRTIHVSIIPDEEISIQGRRGMVPFVRSDHFKNLNVGVDIDEGFSANSDTIVPITVAEKSIWQFNITTKGDAGHASTMPEYTAGQRLQVVIDKLMEFRESEYKKLENPNTTIQDITSLNLVKLGGGTGDNIIPNELWASFDMRILLRPDWNFTDVENMLTNIMEEARLGADPDHVSITFLNKAFTIGRTPTDDSNIWWTELQKICNQLDMICEPNIISGTTDGRFVRELGIPVFGMHPFPNLPNVAHQDDEFINENSFLTGIERYQAIIEKFAMVPQDIQN